VIDVGDSNTLNSSAVERTQLGRDALPQEKYSGCERYVEAVVWNYQMFEMVADGF
jgi:hypothetical protein